VSETAQVELKSARVSAPAAGLVKYDPLKPLGRGEDMSAHEVAAYPAFDPYANESAAGGGAFNAFQPGGAGDGAGKSGDRGRGRGGEGKDRKVGRCRLSQSRSR